MPKRPQVRQKAKRKNTPNQADKQGKKSQVKLAVSLVLLVAALGLSYYAISRYVSLQRCLKCITQISADKDQPVAEGMIAGGIHYKSASLGNKTPAQARETLQNSEKTLISNLGKLSLIYTAEEGEEVLTFTPYDLGLRLDIDKILETALAESKKILGRQLDLADEFRLDDEAFDLAMAQITGVVDQESQDASAEEFDFDNNQFIFNEAKAGRELDREDAVRQIKAALQGGKFKEEIHLKVEITEPGRSGEDLQKNLGHISSASTPIMSYSEARNTNVKIAADRIHGTILQPGESFSYNRAIGEMTEDNGFVAAGIQDAYGNDGLGVGGGLCQPSTTLYIAAVRAGMRIDVHQFHSTPVNYTPIGTDAMVSPWSDLVFTNTSEAPCIITAYFDGATLQFDFYGAILPNGERFDLYVEYLGELPLEQEPEKKQDDSLPPGTEEVKAEPRAAQHVKVYRKRYDAAGNVIDSELLYDHTYPEFCGLVLVNEPQEKDAESSSDSTRQTSPPPLDANSQGDVNETSPLPLNN